MNKFFRLVSMFAIAGVTFAYTSCTDYSEDINKVDNRVDNVEGRLTTVEGQVKNLETTTTQLKDAQAKTDAAVKTLETTLKELQTKHDKDVERIEGITDALRKDVTTLQEKAAAVEALIPTLATKKDLEEVSNKTAEAIAEINKTIGALQGNLETAQKAIAALEGRVSTLEGDVAGLKTAVEKAQKAADDAQTAADKAQSDATLALGNIESLKKALGKYAEEGALESKIAALEKMDSTLQADKFDTEKFGTFFAKELKDVIGAYAEKGVLEAKLAALDTKDAELQDQITKLDAKVDRLLRNLTTRSPNSMRRLSSTKLSSTQESTLSSASSPTVSAASPWFLSTTMTEFLRFFSRPSPTIRLLTTRRTRRLLHQSTEAIRTVGW